MLEISPRLATATMTAFRIRRPIITTNGTGADTDPTVAEQLRFLNETLGKRIFRALGSAPIGGAGPKEHLDADTLLAASLTPKRIMGYPGGTWAANSLADQFRDGEGAPDDFTIFELTDNNAELSKLKLALDGALLDEWSTLPPNTKVVLDPALPAIRAVLVAQAVRVRKLTTIADVRNFVVGSTSGARAVIDYAAVSAAREVIHAKVPNVQSYNVDDSDIVKAIKAANLPLTEPAFETGVLSVVNKNVSDSKASEILAASKKLADIPDELEPQLVAAIKASQIDIDKGNIDFYLPYLLAQVDPTTGPDGTSPFGLATDGAFEVKFLEDDKSAVQVSVAAVKCAAMLYYGMTLGEELEVFNVVNYFTHKYLIRGGIEVRDARLRNDLQGYVFSDRFTDLETNRILDKTRAAERQMFYRQVFNYGRAAITEDVIVNRQYPRLWKVLMLESANYLERAQASPHPDSFVSRQKVMQAVEDLQYNLSTHCTGMANVITPLIYAELNFVIQRIFQHPEVISQIAPVGGTWWRVVERLYMEMKHARPKVTVLYNKARLGHNIIKEVADYRPASFEGDQEFSDFISTVDAFITTQSILQESLTDDLRQPDDEEEAEEAEPGAAPRGPMPGAWPGGPVPGAANGHGPMPPMPIGAPAGPGGAAAPGGEWDF